MVLRRVLGESGHRDQAVMDWIDREQVLFQGDDSQNRLRAGRCEHHNRGLLVALLEFDLHPRHGIALFASIGQLEWPLLLRTDTETFEHISWDPRKGGTGVDERSQRFDAFALRTRDL